MPDQVATPATPTTPAVPSPSSSTPTAPTSQPPEDAAVADAFQDADDFDQDDGNDFSFLGGQGDPAASPERTASGGADPDGDTPSQTPAAPAASPSSAEPAAVVQPAAAPVVATPAVPVTPAAAPAATPTAVATPPAAPAQTPAAAPTAPAQPAQAAQPAAPSGDPVQQYAEWRTSSLKTLADSHFAIDDATVEEIESNPKEALPRLAANIYLTAVENSVAAVTEQLNHTLAARIEAVIEAKNTGEKNMKSFSEAFPGLVGHEDKTGPLADAFRKLNPTLDTPTFIKRFGEYAHLALNIPKPAAAVPGAVKPQSLPAHVPLAAAIPRGAPGVQAPVNAFEALAGARNQVDTFGDDPDDA